MDEQDSRNQAALLKMNDAFNEVADEFGLSAAEFGSVALTEARWIMNTMTLSEYADLIAETLAAANRAINYMQRVISDEKIEEDKEIEILVKFGLPGDAWDHKSIEEVIKIRRKEVKKEIVERWEPRDYDVDMLPGI